MPGAISVLAASGPGGLFPDLFMEKLIVGPKSKNAVDLDAPVADNLKAIARCLEREVHDLVIVVMDCPRHERLTRRHPQGRRAHSADHRRRFVCGHRGRGRGQRRDAVMGIGGAPEE